MFMCGLVFIATAPLANTSDNYASDSVYFQAVGSSETLTNLASTFSASKFEHHRQAAKWSMDSVDDSLLPSLPDADDYLLAEVIPPEWFIVTFTSQYRLCSWKDASLIYKIKNALI